MTPEYSRV